MSKKYFINNLDTAFGQALISELVKEPTEDPPHMCTVRVPVDQKPQGIKKILKREKPKLFRKKAIEQCEVYVYSLDQTQVSDIEFGIEMMQKPFEDNKVFIFVSDIMAWSKTSRKIKKQAPPPAPEEGAEEDAAPPPPPEQQKGEEEPVGDKSEQDATEKEASQKQEQQEEKPIQYTFFQDEDYLDRVPDPKYQYIKDIEDRVLGIKKENVKVFVVCPGIVYGCGQDTFYQLFKASWLQQPESLPYLGAGNNQIPTVHLKDLIKFVIKVAQSPPEGPPYLLALDQTECKTQKALVQAISSGVGSGKISSVKESALLQNPDRYSIDLDMKSSKQLIGTAEQPVQFQWTARKGIPNNINILLKDFCEKEQLRPIKIVTLKHEEDWTNSKIEYIHKIFSEYYRIPVLTIKNMIQYARQFGEQQLCEDLKDEWDAINDYLEKGQAVKELNETMKVLYRALRWRLSQNDCLNRGYILHNYPRFVSELSFIFNKISPKKFKRKVVKPVPVPPKPSEKQIGSEGEVDAPPPEQAKQPQQEAPPEEQEAVEQGEQEENAAKVQPYYPESVMTIKRMGKDVNQVVVDFFTSSGMEDIIYDTTGVEEHQIFQSLRSYIERNGKPSNYLVSDQQLFSKHKTFTSGQNKASLDRRDQEAKRKAQQASDKQSKRQKLAEEMIELVKNQGQEEIKKMPFRNYLMEFVVPTLNEGLLEVSNIIPNDPVDLLAEYLYQKSYDV